MDGKRNRWSLLIIYILHCVEDLKEIVKRFEGEMEIEKKSCLRLLRVMISVDKYQSKYSFCSCDYMLLIW